MDSYLIGKTLLGQYRVDQFVAAGGMGIVYKVWDVQRRVPLAMKVLQSDLAEDPSTLKLFMREANALKKLQHPNIVPFYGVFEAENYTFLLTDYVDGLSLKDLLRYSPGPMPMNDALVILKAVGGALGYAHGFEVVHCDVKPGNVMVDRGGHIYLMDFGVARHADSTTTTLVGLGSPAYMSPEQCLVQTVTPRSDIYSLGVMMYELLTGQRLFLGFGEGTSHSGRTPSERIRYAHINMQPEDPCLVNPQLPRQVGDVLLMALAKKPEQRFQDVHAFILAMANAMGVSVADVPAILPRSLFETAPAPVSVPHPVSSQSSGNNQAALIIGGIVLVGMLIFGAMAMGGAMMSGSGSRSSGSSAYVQPASSSSSSQSGSSSSSSSSGSSSSSSQSTRPDPTNTPRPTSRPTSTPRQSSSSPGSSQTCGSAPSPRLQDGDTGRVTISNGLDVRIRSCAGTNCNKLGQISEGTRFVVVDDPKCVSGGWWIRIDAGSLIGWALEWSDDHGYLLEPY